MGTGKATRLSKAAREFNVGISTIVEFLHKKGFNIDSNPNTKISEELYNILVKEYSSDIDAKKQSEKLSLEQLRNKKETVTIDDEPEEEIDEDEEDSSDDTSQDDEEIIIKDVSSPVKSSKEEKPNVKVVGKIDLEEKAAKKEEKPEQKKEEPVKEETAKKEAEKEPVKEEPKDTKKDHPEEKDSLKVVGKIDLSSLNQKTRPDKKSRKQRQEEQDKARAEANKKREVKTEDAPVQEKEKPADKQVAPEQELYKSKIERLTGPTVVGKINLPDPPKEKKKEPVASSDEQKNKKKKENVYIKIKSELMLLKKVAKELEELLHKTKK